MPITVKEAIVETFPTFSGVKVETSNDIKYLMVEGRTGHWVANLERVNRQNQLLIVSTTQPGLVILAKIKSVRESKMVAPKIEIFFEDAKIENLALRNQQLIFSRNLVGYY
jgi:hypothetical protein